MIDFVQCLSTSFTPRDGNKHTVPIMLQSESGISPKIVLHRIKRLVVYISTLLKAKYMSIDSIGLDKQKNRGYTNRLQQKYLAARRVEK